MLSVLSQAARIALICVLFHLTVSLIPQEIQHPPYGTDMTLQERSRGILGSPFLFDDFKKGILIDNKGQEYQDIELNYDALNHVMLSKKSEEVVMELNRYFYVKAVIDGEEYRNISPLGLPGYAMVIYDGEKIKCFERMESSQRPIKQKALSQETASTQIINTHKYLLWHNDEITEVKKREKDFYHIFTKTRVKNYIKEKSIKLKDDADFARFLAHFESTL